MSSKNNKPIFAPISMSFSIDEIKDLVSNYIKKDRFYFWIDFESQPVDESRTARVKIINRLYEDAGYFDKALSFFTNIKREIISKRKADLSPASDILGTIYGANIVGIDKDPPRMFGQPLPTGQLRMQIVGHKAREFDARTYYYVKTMDTPTKSQNVTSNSMKLGNEVQRQKQYFLEKMEIVTYLSTKHMLQTFSEGRILSDIRKTNPTQTKLDLI